jgi:hypothetical protein
VTRGRDAYRRTTYVFSCVLIALGAVLLVRTASAGGSGVTLGYLIGVAFIAAGALRLVLLRKTGSG